MLFMSLLLVTVSVKSACSDDCPLSSADLVAQLKNPIMPQEYLGNSSQSIRLNDALDLVKINALFFGIENPKGARASLNPLENRNTNDAVISFNSGVINALKFFKAKRHDLLISSYTKALNESCLEGISLQIFAQDFCAHILEKRGEKVSAFNTLLQESKKDPADAKTIASFIDAYYRDKSNAHVKELFDFCIKKMTMPIDDRMPISR